MQTMEQLLGALEGAGSKRHVGHEKFDPGGLVAAALSIDPDRVDVPERAGVARPQDWLPRDKAASFLDYRGRRMEDRPGMIPRACHMVADDMEVPMRRKLLEAGMATIVPESQVSRRADGRRLVGGLCGVGHKVHSDRLIFYRRPQNFFDRPLRWAHLPLGVMLCNLIVGFGEAAAASGDDLRTCFYALANTQDAVLFNAFGRCFGGGAWEKYGGARGVRSLLAMTVIGMGDVNAVDIAQETHEAILRTFGCMREGEVIRYGFAMPSPCTLR